MSKKNYIVYDKEGIILRTGFCIPSHFKQQCQNDEFIMEGVADDSKHKIVNGKVINKTKIEKDKDKEKYKILDGNSEEQIVQIHKKDWDAVIDRLDVLENK